MGSRFCYGLNRPLQLLKRLKERHNHQQACLRTRPVTVKTPIGMTQSTSVSNQTSHGNFRVSWS